MPNIFLKSNTSIIANANGLKMPWPEIIVNFRPLSSYKGDFGFDWIRVGDTSEFGDNAYKDLISIQYKDFPKKKKERDLNEHEGHFEPNAAQFKQLKKRYAEHKFPWAEKDDKGVLAPEPYIVPWMSLYEGKIAKLQIKLTAGRKADFIEFEDTKHYSFTPKRLDISGKSGEIDLPDVIRIECKEAHEDDLELVIRAYNTKGGKKRGKGVIAGKIKAWANTAEKQRERKVVFIQIKTPEIFPPFGDRIPDVKANGEKDRIENYIRQAFIQLDKDSETIDLDLSTDKGFKKFIIGTDVCWESVKGKKQLSKYLSRRLRKSLKKGEKKKYNKFFKAFYFAEGGVDDDGGGLSGYSIGSDSVVVFDGASEQTSAHEFLHSFKLAHSFANRVADRNATFTYKSMSTNNLMDYSHLIEGHYHDRLALWHWQWVRARNSVKKKKKKK